MSGRTDAPSPDIQEAMDFIEKWFAGQPVYLAAILPDAQNNIRDWLPSRDRSGLAAWLTEHNKMRNLYFSANIPDAAVQKKTTKADIDVVVCLHGDFDASAPPAGKDPVEHLTEQKELFKTALMDGQFPPSIILDSGGGVQAFWLLDRPYPIETNEDIAFVESKNQWLAETLGGDSVHDISRVMRLPGTVNWPNENKRGKGRVPAVATIIHEDWEQRYLLQDFPSHVEPKAETKGHQTWPRRDLSADVQRIIKDGPDASGKLSFAGDRSKAVHWGCCELVRAGRTAEEIAEILVDPDNGIGAHVRDQGNPRRYAERQAQRAFDAVAKEPVKPDRQPPPSGPLIMTSADFVGGFEPPDYLIDRLIQRRFLYSMTGKTGHGKTTVLLRIIAHVALGKPIGDLEVERQRVLFFAGENPDDIRCRWIKLCEDMRQPIEAMDVCFLPGTPAIGDTAIRKLIDAEVDQHGPFGLVVIDTSAAYFRGAEENSNAELGAHARMFRTFTDLPTGPAVIVSCHPTKNPNMDDLLPRGGGAFIAEVDGNFACIRDGTLVRLTTHGKFRGPDFAPINFQLLAGTSEMLVDSKGRKISTVTAKPISEAQLEMISKSQRSREDQLLVFLLGEGTGRLSLSDIAKKLDWLREDGTPNKQLVQRARDALAKDKLVSVERDGIILTGKGKEAASKAAKGGAGGLYAAADG